MEVDGRTLSRCEARLQADGRSALNAAAARRRRHDHWHFDLCSRDARGSSPETITMAARRRRAQVDEEDEGLEARARRGREEL